MGVKVAKHGNRAASSKSGAADVLAALGVNIEADMATVERALHEVGTSFLWAQKHHTAMRHVGPTRAELGTRTIFNLLGPMSNPAGVKRQLLGVFSGDCWSRWPRSLRNLGTEHAWLVHGSDGLDEITTTGPTHVVELRHGAIRRFTIAPEDFGIARSDAAALKGGDAASNAQAIRALFDGAQGPYRDIVLLNTAQPLSSRNGRPICRLRWCLPQMPSIPARPGAFWRISSASPIRVPRIHPGHERRPREDLRG